eukprot:scaffold207_cov409-Prasinococcus_capsulatus_cf.AAC.141
MLLRHVQGGTLRVPSRARPYGMHGQAGAPRNAWSSQAHAALAYASPPWRSDHPSPRSTRLIHQPPTQQARANSAQRRAQPRAGRQGSSRAKACESELSRSRRMQSSQMS